MTEPIIIERGGRPSVSASHAHAVEEFCSRWRKPVFVFGRTFLGDSAAAEELTCEVLLAVYRRRARLNDHELLPQALRLALRATHKYRLDSSRPAQTPSRLEAAIQRLPSLERAVVIMRNLLHMDWESVALAIDLSRAQAHEAWVHGIFQLNKLLQNNLTKEAH